MMRYGLLLLILLLPTLSWGEEIYQFIDRDGVAHFSDTPSPNSRLVDLSEDSIYSSSSEAPLAATQPVENASDVNKAPPAQAGDANAVGSYTRFSIVQPKDQATIFNNSGTIDLTIAVVPALKVSDQIIALLDGQEVPSVRNDTLVTIDNVERGSHTVQLKIQDKTGKALIATDIITINMRRPSLINNPNLRPALGLSTTAAPIKK